MSKPKPKPIPSIGLSWYIVKIEVKVRNIMENKASLSDMMIWNKIEESGRIARIKVKVK